MPKRPNQKIKLLALAEILQRDSDEAHPMSVSALISALEQAGVAAERKSLYGDIEALRLAGMDVVTVRGRANGYYVGERAFQIAEVKLLVDAVQSAKFITEGKSRALIKKICALASRHEAGRLQRQVHVSGRAKTLNERTYYVVDALHNAIAQNRQISFRYFEWAVDAASPHLYARRWRRGGALYTVSPWTLLWDDENYYLLAYDGAAGMIKHYRVDKMDGIATLEAPRLGRESFEALDLPGYGKRIFGMFGGEETDVKLRFENRLIGVVADRFGSDVILSRDGDGHFVLHTRVAVSPQFLSWVMGFGAGAEVLAPREVAQLVLRQAREIAALYRNGARAGGGE